METNKYTRSVYSIIKNSKSKVFQDFLKQCRDKGFEPVETWIEIFENDRFKFHATDGIHRVEITTTKEELKVEAPIK